MHYAGSNKYFSYAAVVLAVISAWIALIPFYDIWRIIKEVLEVRPNFSEAVNISRYGWQAVGFALLGMIFYIAALMCSHKAAFRVQANMRIDMMKHIMKLPLGYVEAEGTGKIRKIVADSSSATETFLAHNLPDKAVSYATPIGLLVMMMVFDWRLGLISLIPAVIAFVLMGTLMMGPKMAEDMKQYQNALETMSAEAVEYVRGIPVVKTFGQTVFTFKSFKAAIDEYEKWTLGYTKNMLLPMVAFTTAANGIFAALIIATFKLTSHGVTNDFVLNLFFYVLITSILTVTLMKVAYAGEAQMIVDDALNRMYEILETEPLSESKKNEKPQDSSITLDNVIFAYENSEVNAIDGINLSVKAGEHIALVGPSGGGKTTLASLIARFWDVKRGAVKIGGTDVRNIPSDELMNYVSYVFQDSKLLKMSIMDNIRMGRPDATDEEVMQALRDAQCMDIIEKFPDGVNTMIGSKGIYVSGGECQRLSIARAFLKNAPVLILDEATASLDVDNESLIQESISKLIRNKTVLIIAHRMRTVDGVDKIVVLKDGKVAEQGTPEELRKANGIYKHMADMQLSSDRWKYQ
ncbi:MAG: ABC transporter ATP-binding protein/permease [Oscillospiraceae bacterium]|nr:ABC transporter ATP-binding protein/permease [Oscillospiraceae bacterium]